MSFRLRTVQPLSFWDRQETSRKPHPYPIAATILPRNNSSLTAGSHPERHSVSKEGTSFGHRRDLPILGRAQGGSDGNIVIEDGAIDWTFRPADLQGVQDAFAAFVTGESMQPKYANNDLIYVHPHLPVRKGRYVLVELDGHRGLVKRFEKWDGDTLVLTQFNPARELRLARAEVLRMMLIIGSLDA